jgi:hypothetical protein
MWGAFSGERTGVSFTTAAGARQRSHSRVKVAWDSRPYFTTSDSRLPFLSPPMTRRATVDIFDPASTRDTNSLLQTLIPESESELLYEWRFTSNQFVLAPSPFRLTARISFSHLNTFGHSPYMYIVGEGLKQP